MKLWRRGIVACLAIGIDLLFGDPPNRYHPVAWMGRAIGRAQACAPRRGRLIPLAYGAAVALGGALAVGALGRGWERLAGALPGGMGLLLEAALLKSTVGLVGLERAAREIRDALTRGDLAEARRLTSWHLVSRDTTTLDEARVAAATIESVAENTSDGILGPLVYHTLGGLPGALAYRFLNTCDSMLGYRDAAREWLGKVPARLDDLLNLLPARLTAALLIAAARLWGEDAAGAIAIHRRDAHLTASPNAGHPMSTMAGALGVELEKIGYYRLGAGQRLPRADDITRAIRLMRGATALAAGGLLLLGLLIDRKSTR